MSSSARRIAQCIGLISILSSLALSAQAPQTREMAKPKVILVELFTSEGCSDCPAADELLRRVDQKQANSGQLIVGISEHVTYWNHLGWADPFSLKIYDQRQDAYSSRFGLDSVYTPQMVVNGAEQFVGSDSAKLSESLRKEEKQPSSVAVHILSASVANGHLNVTYSASGYFPSQGLDLIAVLADDSDQSSVPRGENSGRTLKHVAVARSLTRVTTLKAQAESTTQLPLPTSYSSAQAHHLILFVQAAGNGRVFDADTKPF